MNQIPLSQLRVRCDGLTLRSPLDDDVDALMAVYAHDFNFELEPQHPETDLATIRAAILDRVQQHRHPRSHNDWKLELIVEADPGIVLGWATLGPRDDSPPGTLESTSWVAVEFRQRRHATSIRKALLSLAFNALDADVAFSRAQGTNKWSSRISEKLGYTCTGFDYVERTRGRRTTFDHWELSREAWHQTAPSADIVGHEQLHNWLTPPYVPSPADLADL